MCVSAGYAFLLIFMAYFTVHVNTLTLLQVAECECVCVCIGKK